VDVDCAVSHLDGRARHFLAGLRAFAAGLRALFHHLVAVGDAFAIIGALSAYRGAQAAKLCGMMRGASHETRGGAAAFRAVVQQTLMLRRSVIASQVEAMMSGLRANTGAFAAIFHAGKHFPRWHFV
jgi:hypothetical protein